VEDILKSAILRRFAVAMAVLGSSIPLHFVGAQAAEAQPAARTKVSGRFSANDLPADRDGSVLLTIPAPGRYAIAARSPSGVALQLVDMIAGPGEAAGAAGLRDGRLDLLLDKGVYKLRLFGAKGASGKARLTADAFQELQPSRETLVEGRKYAAELGDLAQRTYALDVGPSGRVSIEALGRALRDLRLWRASGELVDIAPQKSTIEAEPGRPSTRLSLTGVVEPGRYLVTAYGGEPLIWAEGGDAQPFRLRLDPPAPLAAGVAEGVIGPFGSARFEAPAGYDTFRLELPRPTAARIAARRGESPPASATIGKASREPVASVSLASNEKDAAIVEIFGYEGQPYTLRALRQSDRVSIHGSGPHLVSIDVAGEGADEVPATALLARSADNKVIAADLPRIGAGGAWRRAFNLRGPTSLLFEATASGPIAIRTQGPRARVSIEPALGSAAPRADGREPAQYDLQAGFYLLSLEPVDGAAGVLDVTIGAPGRTPEPAAASPARSVISFGELRLDGKSPHFILVNKAPGLVTGPRAVALPADLEKAPLPLWRQAGQEIAIPVRAPRAGKIVAVDAKGANLPIAFADERIENETRFATLRIEASAQPQALGVYFVADPPATDEEAAQQPERVKPSATLTAARPLFFDLARDERREFKFEVAKGGLYRVETLGRLQTSLALGTNLTPRIGEAEANGPGRNGLVTAYLRAGSYRVSVAARESAGHLGLAATPSSLVTTAAIAGEGSARALLAGGRGAIVPIEIPEDGLYRLDLQGLGRKWRARLEDAEGWPLTTPGPLTHLTRRFEKGSYRLVVLPEDVEARLVARLRPIVKQAPLEGHGPHPLPFDKAQKLQWREPPVKTAERAPDVWTFSLSGEADVEIDISEGMIAELFEKSGRESVGKFAAGRKLASRLTAGDYVIEARSLAHDDRLDYDIRLGSKQLQPDAPRFVELPATLEFAIASDRVVDLTSFGVQELTGVLEDADGAAVERLEGRADDWNIALSRRLPAGSYRLRLGKLDSKPHAAQEADESAEASEAVEDADDGQSAEESEPAGPSGVEIRFALPNAEPTPALSFSGVRTVSGSVAHEFPLPPAPEGSLALVAAQSTRETALSIERRGADGRWRVIGYEHGLAPVAAWPADKSDNGALRAVVWTVGGGDAPITIAARALTKSARALGEVALEAAPIEGLATKLCAGLVSVPSASLVELNASQATLAAGSAPGRLLAAARSGPLAPQSDRLWLLSREDCGQRLRVSPFAFSGAEVGLTLGAGERAVLPNAAPLAGKARLWRARSTFGQPGVDAGRGFAVAPGAALALAGKDAPRVWNAAGSGPLRLVVQQIDVDVAAPVRAGALFAGVIPPRTALPVTIGAAGGALTLDLPSGVAAFSAPDEARKLAAFGDAEPISRRIDDAPRTIWLVNATATPAPARLAAAPGKGEPLTSEAASKRFYGAAGQFAQAIHGEKGDRLIVAGGEATFVGDSGLVARGRSIEIDGRGEAVVDHKPGLVALWLERGGKTPWATPAPKPVAAPQRSALEGAAQAFSFETSAPVVVDARSSAPAIVAFTQNGERVIETFPSGVELHRYVAPGKATIEIFSPHDGPLAGTLDIASTPVVLAKDGVNDAIALSAGSSALFTFEVKKTSEIGLGLRAEPDLAELRLLDADGRLLGEGVEQTARLAPGRYFVEARAPIDAPLSVVRLAVLGLAPPPAGPPPEVVAEFLEKARKK
jgi:hypothetical protein